MNNQEIKEALKTHLGVSKIYNISSESGGCINKAHCYETDQGKFFVKESLGDHILETFQSEKKGLETLEYYIRESNKSQYATKSIPIRTCKNKKQRSTERSNEINEPFLSIQVPKPLHIGEIHSGKTSVGAFFIMEYIEMLGNRKSEKCEQWLAVGLSNLHHHSPIDTSQKFGFETDFYIGDLRIPNTNLNASWPQFYTSERLQYMAQNVSEKYRDEDLIPMMKHAHLFDLNIIESNLFHNRSREIPCSIIHGDLWCGNYGMNANTGAPVLYDPGVYRAHYEMDIAMMKKFSGFSSHFFELYNSLIPTNKSLLEDKIAKRARLHYYTLFYELTHYMCFGPSTYRRDCCQSIASLSEFLEQDISASSYP